ncbi:uncharacterized protein LOC112519590 [Cynara cardunculus var. scolymus]|uniref:uncharacterized protein LOC112519590 n=1 Tax=Cynara cardunculus var. scolymus TaxID=59895 RepID=UPI000D624D0B|nr:uncharacterized protein LOC112519590 [Cynara cardunculus var. scolymus]
MTMAISPSLLPALLLFYLLTICKSMALISQFSSTGGDDHSHLIDEIREAELNVVRLETILEESISIVDSKNLYIKESEKLVEEMTSEVDHLQSVLLTMKNYSSSANERLNRLKKEVQLLGAAARRNTFELHILESKAQDAESRLEITKSRVEMMASIVTEQWIQIQHLEQALEIAKRNSKEIKKQLSSIRCSFLKFIQSQFGNLLDDWWEVLERTWSVAKQNHHQLQRFVMNKMQKWKYTAAYANNEVVFFVASALITFPALSLGVFLLNNFC